MVTKIEQGDAEIVKQAGSDYINKVGECSHVDIITGLAALVSSYICTSIEAGNKKSDIFDIFTNALKWSIEHDTNNTS